MDSRLEFSGRYLGVVGALEEGVLELEAEGFEGFGVEVFGDVEDFSESEMDAAEGDGDDKAVPRFEVPCFGEAEVDGNDGDGGGLGEFDDTGLDDVAGAAGAIRGDADVEAVFEGAFHGDEGGDGTA